MQQQQAESAQVKRALSVGEAMRALGVSRATFYVEINEGRLRSFKIGKRRLITPEALGEYITEREAAASERA